LPTTDLRLPYEEASCSLSFTTSRPPEHIVTVEVTDKGNKRPIEKALVTLIPRDSLCAPCRNRTNDRRLAGPYAPTGGYQFCVDKRDYGPFETSAEVAQDTKVTVELKYSPSDPAADRPR